MGGIERKKRRFQKRTRPIQNTSSSIGEVQEVQSEPNLCTSDVGADACNGPVAVAGVDAGTITFAEIG
eukprot:Pgem_evm1s4351